MGACAGQRDPFGPAPSSHRGPTVPSVRWQLLFADLESQLATARAQEALAAVPDLVRAERATIRLADRVRASVGSRLLVHLGDVAGERDTVVGGLLADASPEWLLLAGPGSRQSLVPLGAVQALGGLASHAAPDQGPVRSRLGLPHVLRALARDRVEVQVCTAARCLVGRLDRVGADQLDVTPATGASWTVPLAALKVVRSS